jgi:hypothetical protein
MLPEPDQRRVMNGLLQENPEDLYTELVSDSEGLFSFQGRILRGKEIFDHVWPRLRGTVCPIYEQNKESVHGLLDFATLLAEALQGHPAMGEIPIPPVAALIVKIGLEELCRST